MMGVPKLLTSLAVLLALASCGTAGSPAGALEVSISGLEAGAAADVSVFGPDGFSRHLDGGTTITGLAPGSYEVSAASVEHEGDAYVPEAFGQSVTVEGSKTTAVSVAYRRQQAATGRLEVTISGLPTGVEALVTVGGPPGFGQVVTASAVLEGLAPGAYVVTATDVDVDDDTYAPEVGSQTALVEVGATAAVSVVYGTHFAMLGSLSVAVEGLADEATAAITIEGPEGFSTSLSGGSTLGGLEPGEYTVTANEVKVGSAVHTYAPQPASQTLTVEAAQTVSAVVAYVPVTGALEFVVNGLPSGVRAGIDLSGPDGFGVIVDESLVLGDLSPGPYHFDPHAVVTAADLTDGEVGFTYGPVAILLWDGKVTAGQTAHAAVEYAAVTGSLQLMITGLPTGVDADVRVAGRSLRRSRTLNNLLPETYVVSPRNVSVGGFTFAATVSSFQVEVSAGNVAAATVRYRAVDGKLDITISGLPSDLTANVTVSGPSVHTVPESTTLTRLEPGEYVISAQGVTRGQIGKPSCRVYSVEPSTQTKTVRALELTSAAVTYTEQTCPDLP